MRSSGRFYLYKRKNGRYYVGKRIDGRVVWRSTGERTRSAALRVLREYHFPNERKTSQEMLGDFFQRFLEVAPQMFAAKTLEIYMRTLARFSRVVGECLVSDLSGAHWDRFKATRLKTISPASVNIELRALRAVLNTAVRWGVLAANPFAGEKLVPIPESLPAYFSRPDFQRLLQGVTERLYRDIFVFAVLTGCRREEILNLKWSDYDSERGMITIQCSGGFKTKTRRIRSLPIHPIIAQIMAEMPRESELVFTKEGRKLEGNNVSRRLRQYIRLAGLDRRLHFHSLRHSFASWLIQSGESLYVVQKLLGHASPRMSQIYSHLEHSNLHASVQRIGL